jgi:hypothetical protein
MISRAEGGGAGCRIGAPSGRSESGGLDASPAWEGCHLRRTGAARVGVGSDDGAGVCTARRHPSGICACCGCMQAFASFCACGEWVRLRGEGVGVWGMGCACVAGVCVCVYGSRGVGVVTLLPDCSLLAWTRFRLRPLPEQDSGALPDVSKIVRTQTVPVGDTCIGLGYRLLFLRERNRHARARHDTETGADTATATQTAKQAHTQMQTGTTGRTQAHRRTQARTHDCSLARTHTRTHARTHAHTDAACGCMFRGI